MRNYNRYDVIYCDIDNTLIYGWYTDLMEITWRLFHSNTLAKILMDIQQVFKLYKVNPRILYILKNFKGDIIFLSARMMTKSTEKLIEDILHHDNFRLLCLQTNNPKVDKLNVMIWDKERYKAPLVFDDNRDVRWAAQSIGIDAFDPTVMFERKYL